MSNIDFDATDLSNEPKKMTFQQVIKAARTEGENAHLGQGALSRLAVLVAQAAIDGAIDLYAAPAKLAGSTTGGNKPAATGDKIDEVFTEYLRSQTGYKRAKNENGKTDWDDEAKTLKSQKQQVSKLRQFAKVGHHTWGAFGQEGVEVLSNARDLYAEHVRACAKAGVRPVSNEYDFLCNVARAQSPSKDVLKNAKNKSSVRVEPLTTEAIQGLLQPKERVEKTAIEKLTKMAKDAETLAGEFDKSDGFDAVIGELDRAASVLRDAIAKAQAAVEAANDDADNELAA